LLCAAYQVFHPVGLSSAKSKCGVRTLLAAGPRGTSPANCLIDVGTRRINCSTRNYWYMGIFFRSSL